MKTLVNFLFVLTLSLCSFGQTTTSGGEITYQVIEDNPESANTNFIAPELGLESNSTDLGVFLGASARKSILKGLTFEGNARYDVVSLNAESVTFQLEGGVFLPLMTKEKSKEVPVFLSYNPYAGRSYEDNKAYNIEETKYVKIPSGKFKNQYGLRGGLHYRSIGVEDLVQDVDPGNINLGGIYLGGQMTSQAFVKILVNNDVERIGAGFSRVYADIFLLPLSELSRDDIAPAAKSDGVLGWRVGYQWYISPHEGEYKFFGNSIFGAEIGSRPLSGFMFNLTWGYALNRS